MANSSKLSQAFQDQLAEIQEVMEREKVELTPEVEEYLGKNIQRITNMIAEGKMPSEDDLRFFEGIKAWVSCADNLRQRFPDIASIEEQRAEAEKRKISLGQWFDLLHMAKVVDANQEWIDEVCDFPGGGRIEVTGYLTMQNNTSLTRLPDNLSVIKSLDLIGCASLTHLPDNLYVGVGLFLSPDLNEQVLEDAKRLKKEGKIKNIEIIH